jgi:hypothetical protein
VDSTGNVYSENAASDASFGGRIFRFPKSGGTQEFTGNLNYFSQMLMFAQPTAAGPMAFGPDNRLYVVDNLSRQVKQVDVNAAYDPYRRVGQRFADIPSDAGAQAYDMEIDSQGNVYLLYSGQTTPPYIVPGQYLRLVRTEAPGGMVLDRSGNIYYADQGDGTPSSGRIMMFRQGATQPVTIISGLNKPGDIELIPSQRGLIISEEGGKISRKYFGLSATFQDSSGRPVNGLTLYVTRSGLGTTKGYRMVENDVYFVPELLEPALTDRHVDLTVEDPAGRTRHYSIEMGQDLYTDLFGQTIKNLIITD